MSWAVLLENRGEQGPWGWGNGLCSLVSSGTHIVGTQQGLNQ